MPSLAFTRRLPSASVYTTVPASPLRNALTLFVKSLPFKPSLPVTPLSPAATPVPSAVLPSRPSEAVLPILAALSIVLRVSASKPKYTLPFSPVVIAIPFFVVSTSVPVVAFPIVPVPATKSRPCFNFTVLASASEAPFARYVIDASKFFTVTVASPKSTLPGSAGVLPAAALPGVIVIVLVPFLMTRLSVPLPEIPFIFVNVSANFTVNPLVPAVASFSTRILTPASAFVAVAVGSKFLPPFTVNVSPRSRCTEALSSPAKFIPAVVAAATFVSV